MNHRPERRIYPAGCPPGLLTVLPQHFHNRAPANLRQTV